MCEETKEFFTTFIHIKRNRLGETKATLHTAEDDLLRKSSSTKRRRRLRRRRRGRRRRRRRRRRLAPSFFAFVFVSSHHHFFFWYARRHHRRKRKKATTMIILKTTTMGNNNNNNNDNSNSSKNDIIVEDLTTPREGEVRSTHKMFESEWIVVDSLREDPTMDGETHLDDLLEIGRSVDDFVDDGGPGVPKHYVCNVPSVGEETGRGLIGRRV